MSDRTNINERLSARRTEEDIDAFDDHGCFAILRGIRPDEVARLLSLEHKNDNDFSNQVLAWAREVLVPRRGRDVIGRDRPALKLPPSPPTRP